MNNLLCIESLAGSFENCIKLGIDNKIRKELNFFKKKKGIVYYLSKDTQKFNLGKNIQHITLPKKTPAFLKNLIYLTYPFFNLDIFKKNDIYYIHNISGCFPAVLAKSILRNKRIISRYDWNWSFTFKQKYSYPVYLTTKILEYISLKYSDIVIASTKRLKKDVQLITKDSKKKIIVLPNWVDQALFKPSKKKSINNNPLLISIGRLDDGKNYILLLKSIKKLKSINPEILVIGNGEKKEELLAYAKKNKIKLKIIERVPNTKIPKLLQKADIFLMTSKYEGCPHVLMEALSCGLPVIGTNVRGIKDIIKHNHNGILCEEDPNKIAKAIEFLINNEKTYNKLRKNTVKSVRDRSFDKIMDEVYKNIKNEN